MSAIDRQYDIVVWGATGVAGGFVAEYLAEQYDPEELSLAVGGRSEERLESAATSIVERSDAWDEVPIVTGDARDPESLRALAERTRVVCTTVGPYTKYGTPLVEACIDTETHYCDLTGEINWIREIVDRFHDDAVEADTRIVNSCGFDAVPADLGTLLVQSVATEEYDAPCERVRIYVEEASGGVSGGTLASFTELFEAASNDPTAGQALANPYSLAPPGERDGVDSGEQRRPRNDELRGSWTGPSPMAAVNERVVRRSNALLDYAWGEEFRCTEAMTTGSGIAGAARAVALSGGVGLFTAAMSVDAIRPLIQRHVFPDPGEGPTRKETENGHFKIRVLGRGETTDGPFTLESIVEADWGGGYGATGRMMGEAAMCLLRDDTDSPFDGGVLTPASGIGKPLAERLRSVGFTATARDVSDNPIE